MKKIVLIAFLGFTIGISAQVSDTLFMSKMKDIEWIKTYDNKTKFKFLKFADGSVLQVGDKMKIGRPSSINQSNQQSIGIFGSTNHSVNSFSYIMLGLIANITLSGINYLPEAFKGRELEIQHIKFMKSKQKNPTACAMIILDNPGMDITVLNVEAALQYGEIVNPNALMTSDEALSELQRAKTKLDLGVISQEEYDSIKKDLIKYIK